MFSDNILVRFSDIFYKGFPIKLHGRGFEYFFQTGLRICSTYLSIF